MNKIDPLAYQGEQTAVATHKSSLPPHAGELRYRQALERDRLYQGCVFAALGIAFFSGTGFGTLAIHSGWLGCSLLAITVAGVVWRLMALRFMGSDTTVDSSGVRSRLSLLLGPMVGFGILGSLFSGASCLWCIAATLVAAGLIWLGDLNFKVGAVLNLLASLAVLGLGFGIFAPTHSDPFLSVWGGVAVLSGIALGAFVNRGEQQRVLPTMWLTWLAVPAWLSVTVALISDDSKIVFAMIFMGCLGFAVLDHFIKRLSFAPVVALVILLHLSGAAYPQAPLYEPVWLQYLAVVAEFVLLIAAGYRHALAEIVRLPRSTYRSSPQCIVPRLDRAWDHPLKIDVI